MLVVGKSMNNLLSFLGLVDARISASEKDLPVMFHAKFLVKMAGLLSQAKHLLDDESLGRISF